MVKKYCSKDIVKSKPLRQNSTAGPKAASAVRRQPAAEDVLLLIAEAGGLADRPLTTIPRGSRAFAWELTEDGIPSHQAIDSSLRYGVWSYLLQSRVGRKFPRFRGTL